MDKAAGHLYTEQKVKFSVKDFFTPRHSYNDIVVDTATLHN